MWRTFKNIGRRGQRGFTLVELVVAVAIVGIIIVGVGISFVQIMKVTAQSSNHMQAVRQLQNAGGWISRDGQQSQPALIMLGDDLGTPSDNEVLTLGWDYQTYGGDKHVIVYVLQSDHNLRRDDYLYVNGSPTGPVSNFVAENITSVVIPPAGSFFELTITATVGGFQPSTETRTYYFRIRPGS